MTHFRLRFALAGLLLIGGGCLVRYWVGYKDNFWLQCLNVFGIVFGWMAWLLVGLASLPKQRDVAAPGPLLRLWRRLRPVVYGIGFLGWLALLVGTTVAADIAGEQRQAQLLATHPTAYATATVTARRVRSGSRGSHIQDMLITYQAGATLVHQALPDRGQYELGQQLRVKYVVDIPDLFEVVQ